MSALDGSLSTAYSLHTRRVIWWCPTAIEFFSYFEWVDGSTPTGIKTITDERGLMDDAWYDLSGRKLVGSPTEKGIYIHRGKKVVVFAD